MRSRRVPHPSLQPIQPPETAFSIVACFSTAPPRQSAVSPRPKKTSMGEAVNGSFASCVDGSSLARTFLHAAVWSEPPCVRPSYAAHMTAGQNALRGSGPNQQPAFEMR
jgi:hypothetical protein